MWEREAKEFINNLIVNNTILSGDIIGIDENNYTATVIGIILSSTEPIKAVEKYYFMKKIGTVINFYELDKLQY